jgi:hypothetical protein
MGSASQWFPECSVSGRNTPSLLLVLGVCAVLRSGLCQPHGALRSVLSRLQRSDPKFAVVAFLPMSCHFLCAASRGPNSTSLDIVLMTWRFCRQGSVATQCLAVVGRLGIVGVCTVVCMVALGCAATGRNGKCCPPVSESR